MSDDELNIKVAELLGWCWDDRSVWNPKGGKWARWFHGKDQLKSILPDCASDLNTCHEFEVGLNWNDRIEYCRTLQGVVDRANRKIIAFAGIDATARQRAEAICITLTKRKEDKP